MMVCPLGWLVGWPGGEVKVIKKNLDLIPPSHGPRKLIPKGILIWSARRPLARLCFLVHNVCDFSCGFAKILVNNQEKNIFLSSGVLNCS